MRETAELNLVDPTQVDPREIESCKKSRAVAPGEKHVLFKLGGETFCLPACKVRGVMGVGSLIPAVNQSFLLIGFVFCQAKALPVFDLRTPLGLPTPDRGGKEEVLVLSLPSDARFRMGILVESLESATEIHPASIRSIPHGKIPQQFLRGSALLNGREVLALDLDFLISPAALRRLSTIG